MFIGVSSQQSGATERLRERERRRRRRIRKKKEGKNNLLE
jgi:hypothetical protein